MWSSDARIAPGHLVIVWLTRDMVQSFIVTPGKEFNSKYGNYRHSDLLGLPYGSKVASRTGKGFIHVLRPTPELWTLALPHRTQILYIADIAFITSWLNIRPGSVVIEAGTGSGSFSHSVARTVGSTGKLWSYEFHEARANKARDEFTRHGMSDVVTLTHRNVCKDGFTVEDTADSVFLDLPAPWEAVEHAKRALRRDCITRICCFSPCIEQVLRTVSALNDAGFTDITMYETLLRPHEVSEVPTLLPIGAVSKKLQQSERKREEKRLRQISNARARHAEKRKREQDGGPEDNDATGSKRVKTEDETRGDAQGSSGPSAQDPASPVDPKALTSEVPTPPPATTQIVSKVIQEVRGHTSYLTFACLLPAVATQSPTCPVEKHESAPSPRTPASQTSDVTAGPSIDET
ncbi:hypothetical protein HETIRDRAFT_475459 [Heterobasidion irregulare TC 32-1]|uniref:tRNA (adenine(58)-N(1))-methyltransferase catalytic subunit TRM61 n=1 Tax=Heterobasidion irregulare (strain TC 32-1) TaxID=747525 RepID=W4KA39_HETIT|nr:uncharacterized protein HETIRDRAFT_384346 [Heterobasidion irregulare TC 32-1]XP_009546526.1 uncharacterized protein HETIRDRAFT_475459 [Heterobasidion irregulare TC 32-1]ETW81897.1 hypothetical protein HETIRDRAFT_384346 [Heterobasidion irregulare TC 32-1]ETW81936.1 hypothetical protein HETIRDRAFT_475459 [Heterobasidion irregulare TC 32-1]